MTFAQRVNNTKVSEGQAALFYLGQVGFLIKTPRTTLLIDPYLSDYCDKMGKQVVWKRLYEPPCKPEELPHVDYVFCTHAHVDHSDPWTLPVIAKMQPHAIFCASAGLKDHFARFGIAEDRWIGAVQDVSFTAGGMEVTPVPAYHEKLHLDENGVALDLGYVFRMEGMMLYHAGDTVLYDGLADRIRHADAAFIPVNGRDYFRDSKNIIGNTNSAEALLLAEEADISMLIPTHHDLYDVNRINGAEFMAAHDRIAPFQKFHIFAPGEKYILTRQ